MSKPQVASEPSMEEILSSIRKMISDDKPGPRPMPDMGRTPFGGLGSRETTDVVEPDISELTGNRPVDVSSGQGPNFNSLSDALKVATALSDQRRSLQQEIASVIEKGPRNNLEALTELSQGRPAAESSSSVSGRGGSPASTPSWRAEPQDEMPAATAEPKQDHLLSFDFGTVVPKREEAQPKPQASDARWNPASGLSVDTASAGPATKLDDKSEAPAEARVLPLRAGLGHGQNGAAANVSPFPRPTRDTGKLPELDVSGSAAKPAPAPAFGQLGAAAATSSDAFVVEAKTPAVREPSESKPSITEAFAEAATLKVEASKVPSEALIDAVVDLVQQQPGAMSVFASGASFIGGVSGKKPAETLPAIVEVRGEAPEAPEAPEATSPKLDGAAAALLRPMLRQWLAENMERILEEALRSELSDQVKGGNTPDKS